MLRRSCAGAVVHEAPADRAATDLQGSAARRRSVRHVSMALIAVAVLTGCGAAPVPATPPPAATPPPTGLPPSALPFLGVACPRPNSITCDRVGIGVGLHAPTATAVTVWLAGRIIRLRPPADPPDDLWLGYLRDAGLRQGALDVHLAQRERLWFGSPEVFVRVRVTAVFPNGTTRTLAADDLLHPGFG
jgi:hypothetical protein